MIIMYDYFIASRYRNKDSVLDVVQRVRATGKTIYCFIESAASIAHVGSVDAEPEQAMKTFEAIPDFRNDSRVRAVFDMDMQALRDSTTVIVLLPAGKSSHIEASVAYGWGKDLILVGEQKEAESLYCIFDEVYSSIGAFIASLTSTA